MTYPEDYVDAHRQHWTDAELLFQGSRWLNADQLYGISAECGLKALMPALHMPVEFKHVNVIWPDFAKFAASARGRVGARFVRLLPKRTPFANWSINNRYAHSRHFSQVGTVPHQIAARQVRNMMLQAKLDGVI